TPALAQVCHVIPNCTPTAGAPNPEVKGYMPQTCTEEPTNSSGASTYGIDPPPRPITPRLVGFVFNGGVAGARFFVLRFEVNMFSILAPCFTSGRHYA